MNYELLLGCQIVGNAPPASDLLYLFIPLTHYADPNLINLIYNCRLNELLKELRFINMHLTDKLLLMVYYKMRQLTRPKPQQFECGESFSAMVLLIYTQKRH